MQKHNKSPYFLGGRLSWQKRQSALTLFWIFLSIGFAMGLTIGKFGVKIIKKRLWKYYRQIVGT